jgi:hypothetical protein
MSIKVCNAYLTNIVLRYTIFKSEVFMRLWSLHPSLLDTKGLVAAWREAKLALAVLEGKTKGYKFHPQLDRFKTTDNPVLYLKHYLYHLYQESLVRHYKFDVTCIDAGPLPQITVNSLQLDYEYAHLSAKVVTRSPAFILSQDQTLR